MEFLRNWVLNIVTVMVFIVFIEIIVPSEKFKKHIKLVTGLVLMIVIINPIVLMVNKNFSIDKLTAQSFNNFGKNELKADSQRLNDLQNDQIISVYKDKISQQVKEQILSVKGINEAEVSVKVDENSTSKSFGTILNIDAAVSQSSGESNKTIGKIDVSASKEDDNLSAKLDAELKDRISGAFGVPKDKIKITVQKNGKG